jgi:hypothetical protein
MFSQPGDTIRFRDAGGTIRKVSREELVALGGKFLQHLEKVRATQEKLDLELASTEAKDLENLAVKAETFLVEKK